MTINQKLHTDVQSPSPGNLVTLFELDMTDMGGTTSYFVMATISGAAVELDGQAYTPIDVKAEGFDIQGGGKLPRPTITVSNVSKSFQSLVGTYDDLVGAVLTRKRTYSKYLDGESAADTSAYFTADIWVIEQKTQQNKFIISWQLSAYLDFEGTYLPKRQIIRDTCLHTYRTYDAGWTAGNCPYAGTDYFKRDGTATTIALDVCGKKMSDCRLRYPLKADELPLWSYPTVAKTRIR